MSHITSTSYYTLIDPNKLPHTSTAIIDPYDNTTIVPQKEDTLASLTQKITTHRTQNSYPQIPSQQLQDYIIKCLYETSSPKQKTLYFKPLKTSPTISQATQIMKAVFNEVFSKEKVSTKQATARAQKCLTCPHHKQSAKPPTLINKILPNSLESNVVFKEQEQLGVCAICGCGMQAKIKFTLHTIIASMYPDHFASLLKFSGEKAFSQCWIFEEATQTPALRALILAKLRIASPKYEKMYQTHIINNNTKQINT